MKTIIVLLAASVLAHGAAVEKGKVRPEALQQAVRDFDKRVQKFSIDDPLVLLGGAHAIYLEGFGAVLTAEVNLASTAITPFRPQLSTEEKLKLRDKKRQRLGTLKEIMQQALLDSAAALHTMPPDEQIVVGVTLAYFGWENREGLPDQLILQTTRQNLLDFRAGRLDQTTLSSRTKLREID